jgi:hypothetical protein
MTRRIRFKKPKLDEIAHSFAEIFENLQPIAFCDCKLFCPQESKKHPHTSFYKGIK